MPDDSRRAIDRATTPVVARPFPPTDEWCDGSPSPARLHALDAVRGFALLLGIVFHATMSFVPSATKIWIVEDSHRSTALAALCFSIHAFRLTTFFLIAGFFAHMSFHRHGAKAFIRERL